MRKLLIVYLAAFVLCVAPAASAQQERGGGLRAVTQLPSKEKRWALIIGVDDYGNGIQKLYGAVNDSKALREALVKYANFPEEQVIVLTTGGDGEQPTRTNIFTRLFRLLKERVPKDGLLLFAFSGHGVERDKQVFLLPSDAMPTKDIEELRETAVGVDGIKRQIENAGIQQVLILLDACRNDPEAGKGDRDNPLTEAYARGFRFHVQNKGIEAFATIYATSLGKRAYEFRDKETGLQRGFFNWALVKGLEGGAANVNGEITLGGLVGYVGEAVPEKLRAENVSGEQRPHPIIEGYNANKLVIALSARGAAPFGGETSSPKFHLERAWALHDEGKFDDAIKEYEKAIRLDPDNVDTHVDLGNAYDDKGDYDQAIQIYTRVIQQDPDYPVAYYNRGNVYSDKGMLDAAIKDYDKAIKLAPRYSDALVNRGNAYHRKGDDGRALKDYAEAIRINPKQTLAYYNRGIAYDDAGNYDEALRDYAEVIALNPNDLEVHLKRAKVYGARGDVAKAITDLSVYLTFKPKSTEALIYRATLYSVKGSYKDALADLEKAINLEPGLGDAFASRGSIYALTREHAKAFADYNKALEINPNDSRALGRRGNLFAAESRFEQALADYKQAVAVDPQDYLAYFNLGSYYARRGDYVRASENFKRMKELIKQDASDRRRKADKAPGKQPGESLGLDPEKLIDHFVMGISSMADNDYGKAAGEFSRAIKEAPQFTFLYLLRGAAYSLKGDNAAALSDAKLLIALNPEDVTAYLFQGDVYAEEGDYRQAIASYSEAIRLSPDNVQAYRNRADAYERAGDRSKAKADRQRVAALEGQQVNR